MIVIDGLLLLNVVAFFALVFLLSRSLGREKELRKIIVRLENALNERALLITRLLHEADKHGSDDAELLDEAKQVALLITEREVRKNGQLPRSDESED